VSEQNRSVSIVVLSYNNVKDLPECIRSLIIQTYHDFEIIIVDNGSTDGSEEFIRKNYPKIKIIQTGMNLGYSAGNNVGFEAAKGEYIVVVNPDTVADPKWLAELIKPLESDQTITATTSKILMYYQKDRINTCSNKNHPTGLTFCRGLNKSVDEFSNYQEVSSVSGCSFAVRKDMLKKINGFDPDFFLYQEDADLSWRIRFAGGKIMYVPKSIIYHKFKLSITPWKEFYLERNRYLILLKNLDSATLLFLLPSLIVTEIVTMSHAVLNGPKYIKSKLLAYLWILRNNKTVFAKRRETLSKKKISDKEFFNLLDWNIPFDQVIENSILNQASNAVFNSYYILHMKLLNKIHFHSINNSVKIKTPTTMKVCLTCSHGGHLTEILQLMDAFQGQDIFFITYEGVRSSELSRKYTLKNLGKNPIRFLFSIPTVFSILLREKPNIIISTGSEIAIPVFYIAKLLRIKTIFIESICRVEEPSLSGKVVYPVSDVLLVQWKQLLSKFGKKAQYWGNVL
jgi:GT2 family glycosyltransferase